MKKHVFAFLFCFLFCAVLAVPAAVSAAETEDWVLTVENSALSRQFFAAATEKYEINHIVNGYYVTDEATAKALCSCPFVLSAKPAGTAELCDLTVSSTKSDPLRNEQWGFEALNTEKAWKAYGRGSTGVVVCVIDSGFYYEHEDAAVNFVAGKDYVTGEINTYDDTSHGTSVAGVIGATCGNGIGISGLCPEVTVINLRAFYWNDETKQKEASDAAIAQAITDAVDVYDADIISMSFLCDDTPYMKEACEYAADHNVILCAAAGNNALTENSRYRYPASYDCVIGVGSVAKTNKGGYTAAGTSARNSSVFCCAPGQNILALGNPYSKEETPSPSKYRIVSGTSLATPCVASLAALARSINGSLTQEQFCDYIKASALDMGKAGYDTTYGYGMIDFMGCLKKMYDEIDHNVFSDVIRNEWYYDSVLEVYHHGWMVGVSSEKFGINDPLTRAMIVTILYRMEGSPKVGAKNPFKDVPAKTWYTDAAIWGAQNGIVYGRGAGVFAPNAKVTREEMATFLNRYFCEYHHTDLKPVSHQARFADQSKVSSWAKTAVSNMTKAGILNGIPRNGKTYFEPQSFASRSQAAKVLSYFNEE